MSTKTLRKRIALVAVTALGAGILSVAPANADEYDYGVGNISAYSNSVCDVTGDQSAIVPVGALIEVQVDATDVAILSGPIAVTQVFYGSSLGLNSSGKVTVYGDFDTDIPGDTDGGGPDFDTDSATDSGYVNTVATAVGTITVTDGGQEDDTSATSANSITFTVVAACANSTYSASKSYANVETSAGANAGTNIDSTTVSTNGDPLYIRVDARNAYEATLPTGVVGVSATNGARVNVDSDSSGLLSIAAVSNDGAFYVRVNPATAGVPQTTVVTVTYNGVAVATKSLTFLGEATKVNVVGGVTGQTTGSGYIMYTLTDAAGNKVPGSVSFTSSTATARIQTGSNWASASLGTNTLLGTTLPAGVGVFEYVCTAAQGSGSNSIGFTHTSSVNENVLAATATAVCAGGIDTFAVSTDKASYKVGDIATITITAKDSSGAAVSDQTTLGTGALISAGGMTQVGSTSISSNTFTAGTKSYTFQVTAGGAFNVVATLPAGTTTKSATSGYTVASGDVQMSEVLKAIVSLIASINKQIRALQKALLKR